MTSGAVAMFGNPMGWQRIALRAVLRQLKDTNQPHLPLLGVNLHRGVTQRADGDGRPAASEDLSGYKVVSPGNIIMNRLGKPHGSVGVSPWTGITSPAYWVMAVDRRIAEPRFVHHLLRSKHMIAEYERLGKNQPPNQFDISWDAFRSIELPMPDAGEQCRIADFLDAETSRIDRLVGLQSLVLARLRIREVAQRDIAIDELVASRGTVPLRRFVWSVGQGVSPQCDAVPAAEGEWGVLKVSCLRPGVFNPEENKRLPDAIEPDRASEVHEGDLLVTRANTPQLVGSTAVVGKVRPKLLLSDKIFRVRLSERVSADFVAEVASGSRIRALCAASSNGASQSMANIRFEEVKGWPIPMASGDEQTKFVEQMMRSRQRLSALSQAVQRQLALLAERRQALIIAAVTGQIDVTTAGGRNITQGV